MKSPKLLTESQVQWIGVPLVPARPYAVGSLSGASGDQHNHLMQISSDVPAKASVGPATGGQCVLQGGDDTKKELL